MALALGAHRADAGPLLTLENIGDNTYDPNTGLEWLNLDQTAGQSYDSVLNGWNGYTTTMGYQVATRSQIIQLFDDAGASYLGTPSAPTTADLQSASSLLS